jgi:hypothetical protein
MTNGDLYKVKQGIEKSSDLVNAADINFTMSIARIDSEIITELRIIEKGKKQPTDKYKEYLEKKQELDMKYTIQKEDGTCQTLNEQLLIRNPKQYYLELHDLEKEYKDEIDNVKKINDEFEIFLEQECKATISKVSKSCIPAIIKVEQAKLLFPVIE